MSKSIFLLGAYDRFNYGDLLFPIIVEAVLRQHSAQAFECVSYALVESDLSEYGAQKTRPMSELFAPGCVDEDSVVIVAGGGVVGASWTSMRRNLSKSRLEGKLLSFLGRRLGERRLNPIFQRRFGSNSAWPWVVAREDFSPAQTVIYNGVGGSFLGRLPAPVREGIIDKLDHSDFLSVRDGETKRILEGIDSNDRVRLVPDSAVVMSQLFPLEALRAKVCDQVRSYLERDRPYLCFQMAVDHEVDRYPDIARALDEIAQKHDLAIVLLPIGRAQGHEDHTTLRRVSQFIRGDFYQPHDDIGLYDIMALIAGASLFVGTSLHGAVTSQSFAVPHLGMAGIGKLKCYLDTWEIAPQRELVQVDELVARADQVLALPKAELEANRDRLIALAMDNFTRIAEVAGLRS